MLEPTRTGSRLPRGFTVVELMMGITVAAILVAVAAPQMSVFVQNSRIRASSESLQYGLSLARAEAVRLNRNVEFVRSANGWVVRVPGAATPLHSATGREGTTGLTMTVAPNGADRITFDMFGRRVANANASAALAQIDIAASVPPSSGNYRPMRVQILGASGASRLCLPSAGATDSRACL